MAVVIPAIVLLGVLIYSLTSTLLIKMNSESYYKILDASDSIMNQYLSNFRDTARNILADKTLQREMIRSNENPSESDLMNELTFINLNQAMEKYLTSSLISDTAKKTVQNGLVMFSGAHGQIDWGPMFASMAIGVLPTLGLYLFLSKFMIQGMTAGAVKG